MKPSNQQKTQIEKTKRKKIRSQSEPKSYRNYFVHRTSLQGFYYGSIKNSTLQTQKTTNQTRKPSLDDNSSMKNDTSSSRSRQIKTTKQNKSALQKAEVQKFTQIISYLTELFSKTLLPIDLYQQLNKQLTEVNQSGLNLIKLNANENENQIANPDIFTDSWNLLISNFQSFLTEPVKNQLVMFYSSHISSVQDIVNNISNYPPTNLNFVPQWSTSLLQLNSTIKNINDNIIAFKKQNENEIQNNISNFSTLLKNFQLMINETKLFKLSSFSMSKREESHFIVSKNIIRMIKYTEVLSKKQFTNGIEDSLFKATERINSFIPQLHQIFSSQKNEENSQLTLKKVTIKSSLNTRRRASSQKNRKISKETNSKKSNAINSKKTKATNDVNNEDNDLSNNSENANNNANNANDINNNGNDDSNEARDDDENENDNANQTNDTEEEDDGDENDDDEPAVNFQLKSAKKYNKIFKKKLESTLHEEESLYNEITEKSNALESSRKQLRNLKLNRNQADAVQRRNEAIKTKADLGKKLESLRSEVSRLDENLRSKKDEHEQLLSAKKDFDETQMENEYLKNMKKNNTKYLRRLNLIAKTTNSNILVSEITSSLLSPVSIVKPTATSSNSSTSSSFNQNAIDTIKKLQDELDTVRSDYDKLIKERTITNNNDNENNKTLLRIYYDAQRFQQQNQMLQNEIQAAQLRNISIAKETEIDAFFKSFLQSKKKELKELEKEKGEIVNNDQSATTKLGPNTNSKNTSNSQINSSSQISKKSSQSSFSASPFFDRSALLGRSEFDPLDATFNERSRLQQEYDHIQQGPQEETKRRRISIKTKLSKFPPIPEEYVKLDEAAESLMFSRSQMKNAIESNSAAVDSLSESFYMKDETNIAKMIARRRLEQLHIEFPIDSRTEKRSKKMFDAEQEKKRLAKAEEEEEEEEANEEEEEDNNEEEEDDDEEEELSSTKDKKQVKVKNEKKTKEMNNSDSKSSFKLKFDLSAFGTKNKTASKLSSSSNLSSQNIRRNTNKNKKEEEEVKEEEEENAENNEADVKEEEEEKGEEEEEEEEVNNELASSLAQLWQVNNERVEMEEKLRAIEEMFTTLFGDRIPLKVQDTMSLTDKIELVMRQFNKTK